MKIIRKISWTKKGKRLLSRFAHFCYKRVNAVDSQGPFKGVSSSSSGLRNFSPKKDSYFCGWHRSAEDVLNVIPPRALDCSSRVVHHYCVPEKAFSAVTNRPKLADSVLSCGPTHCFLIIVSLLKAIASGVACIFARFKQSSN